MIVFDILCDRVLVFDSLRLGTLVLVVDCPCSYFPAFSFSFNIIVVLMTVSGLSDIESIPS